MGGMNCVSQNLAGKMSFQPNVVGLITLSLSVNHMVRNLGRGVVMENAVSACRMNLKAEMLPATLIGTRYQIIMLRVTLA